MTDIDERVVQMKFDSSDFEQKSKSTLSILDKLHNALSFKDAANSNQLNDIADNIQKVADKAYTIVDRTIDKIKDNIANKLVNFLSENTLGQFKSGFQKYADMTTSVATLKGQGYAMSKITEQLERLNYFTDETSYKFTDMVREIGKFTASGQKLEDATTAMMGIANWAALSGKNATDASRAMYQLSQALGAGQMRLVDYKSIQNLNMDTREFRQNALDAAVAVGTLKDNLNGTWTSLRGKGETFSINEFADKLTRNAWFTSDVMMAVFQQYSEAVDDIYEIYDSGRFTGADGAKFKDIDTTAEAIRIVKDNNEKLLAKFQDTTLDSADVSKLLKKWKNVEKVTAKTVDDYNKIVGLENEISQSEFEKKQKEYIEYVKEYGEVFKGTEADAAKALSDWHTYVSEYGIKSFLAAQEAKTFTEAIESAKDAASTVWTTIYTTVFGNYDEAKEIWTDLANALYEIFVDRLWDLSDVFDYWKTGGLSAIKSEIKDLNSELLDLQETDLTNMSDDEIEDLKQQIIETKEAIAELEDQAKNGEFVNGRTRMFQGIYAFGSGLKSMIFNFRDAWDDTIEDNAGGKKLLNLSEKIRYDGFRFYTMMKDLGESDFYTNIAISIQNILSPLKAVIRIIKDVIGQFLPNSGTFVETMVAISEKIRDLTSYLVPSEKTIMGIARVLRGIVAVFKLLIKIGQAIYTILIKPILTVLYGAFSQLFGGLLDILAGIGDAFYSFEEGIGPMESLAAVGETLEWIFGGISKALGEIVRVIVALFAPAISFVINSVKDVIQGVKELVGRNKGGLLNTVAGELKGMHDRARAAWGSMETLADIFNRYKTGNGLSNGIVMLGEMLDNVITRIGRTILAIFGLEDVLTDSTVSKSIASIKDVLHNVATLLAWIYTTILRPMLQTMFIGIATMIRNLGQSIREGDINAVLTQLREIIKTFTSFQLFTLFRTITKIFGSGGLIRVLHNAATALRSLKNWLGAKAINEFSSAVIKLAVAFAIFAAAAAAISFLPVENFERFQKVILMFGAALGVVLLILYAMTKIAGEAYWGLFGLCGAFLALTALMITLIVSVKLFNDFLDKIIGKTDSVGQVISKLAALLLPFLSIFSVVMLIMNMVKKIATGGNFIQFGLGFIGIVTAVTNIVKSIQTLLDLMHNPKNTLGEIVLAIGILVSMFVMLAASTKLIAKLTMGKHTFNEGLGAGIAMAISIAALALTIRMILIPTLDTMVENRDKFPAYLDALLIIGLSMLAIGGTMKLMLAGGGWSVFAIIAAGLMFKLIATVIGNTLIPALQEIVQMGSSSIQAMIVLVPILLMMGVAFRLILDGIANIFASLGKIGAKNWLSIIIPTGLIIAGVILLCHMFDDTDISFSAASIMAIIGTIVAIVLAFGLFSKMLLKSIGTDLGAEYKLGKLADVFTSMAKLMLVVMAGLVGVIAIAKLLYTDNIEESMDILVAFSMMTLLTLGATLLFFFEAFKSVMSTIQGRDYDTMKAENIIKKAIYALFAVMGILGIIPMLMKAYDLKYEQYINMVATLAIASIVVIVGALSAMGKFIRQLNGSGLTLSDNDIKAIGISFGALIGMIAEVGLIILPNLATIQNVPWETVAAAMLGAVAMIAVVMGMTQSLLTTKNGTFNLKNYVAGIVGFIISLAAVAGYIWVITTALTQLTNVDPTALFGGLLTIILPLGMLVMLVEQFATADIGIKFRKTAGDIAVGLIEIAAAAAAIALSLALLMELFNPGSTWISSLFDGMTNGFKKGSKDLANATDKYIVDTVVNTTAEGTETHSPSGVFKDFGKYIDQGLGLGLKNNARYVVSGAEGLADLTNETFQDALGIASPSKVFYENGRFVVRGFINGMDSETNKNKKVGADMADGFLEGMEEAFGDGEDGWKGLWSKLGMDKDIADAIKEGTEGTAGSLFDSLFGTEALTEEEEKELEQLKSERDQMAKEGLAGTKEYQDKLQKIAQLESKKNGKLTSGIKGSLGDALSQLTGDGNFTNLLEGFGLNISDGIKNGLTGGKGTDASLSDILLGGVSDVAETLGLGKLLQGDIDGALNDTGWWTSLQSAGKGIGSNIMEGIKEELDPGDWLYENLVDPVMGFFSGEGRKEQIRTVNDTLVTLLEDKINESPDLAKYSNIVPLLKVALNNTPYAQLTGDDVVNIFNSYKEAIDRGDDVTRIDILQDLAARVNSYMSDFHFDYANAGLFDKDEVSAFKDLLTSFGYLSGEHADKLTDEQIRSLYRKAVMDYKVFDEKDWNFKEATEYDQNNMAQFQLDILKAFKESSGELWINTPAYEDAYSVEDMIRINEDLNEQLKDQFASLLVKHDDTVSTTEEAMKVLEKYYPTILRQAYKKGLINENGKLKYNDTQGFKLFESYMSGAYVYDYTTNLTELEDQLSQVLTLQGFQEEDFNEEQLNEIMNWARANGLLSSETGTISTNVLNNGSKIDSIIAYLGTIVTDGLKVNQDTAGVSVYTKATDIINKLAQARKDNNTSAIASLSSTKNAMRDEVSAEYARLISIMGSSNYETLPDVVKQMIKEQAEFYEKNWNLGIKSEGKKPEEKTEAEKEREKQSNKAVEYNESRNGINEWLNSQGKAKVKDFSVFDKFIEQTGLDLTGEQQMKLFQDGLDIGWFKIDQDGKVQAKVFAKDVIDTIKQMFAIKSPSRVAYGIMDYFMQGIDLGIHDGMDAVFKTLTELTTGMIKTTDEGLESLVPSIGVMADSLTKDIQPQITPIFDDSTMSFGVSALSKSFDGLSSKVSSTANSFQDKSGRNNGQLDVLSSQVAGMAGLINSFMQMVADGDLININVNAEADPNNIYELVVNTNRQKFKQTGKNPLSY